MATDDKTPDVTLDLSGPVTMENLIKIISAASGIQGQQLTNAFAEALKLTAPPRYIQIGEYDPKTGWQPVAAEAHTLTRKCFQNGIVMNEAQMTNKEIDLLNAIDRSGRYINRLVEVIIGEDGGEEVIYLRYRNKTEDQRNALREHFTKLYQMLQLIINAQNAAEADLLAADKPKTRKRRPYLDSDDQTGSVILAP
jgi:hypothetical protein